MPRQSLKQRSDGRYRVKYKGLQFYGATQSEAIRKRDEYKQMERAGVNIAALGIMTGDYCLQWLEVYKANVTPAVQACHLRNIRRFCNMERNGALIGDTPLQRIKQSDIMAFVASLKGLSAQYARANLATIKAVFRAAVADRLIQYDPTVNAKGPRGTGGTHRALEPWERDLIYDTPHRFRLAALVMLYAGLRRGEVTALTVEDIDFQNKVIHVRRAYRLTGKPTLTTTKTKAGIRDVPLPEVLENELKGKTGPIIKSAAGEVMTAGAWLKGWRRYNKVLSNAHGSPVYIRPHDLRHTYCTLLYDAGIDVKTAQLWMGHASLQVTLSIYTHLSQDHQEKAKNLLENASKNWVKGSNRGSDSDSISENR